MGQPLWHCHVFLGRIDDLGGGIVGPVPHPCLGWDRLGRIGHRGVVHGANPDCHPVAVCHIPVAVFRTGDGGAFGGRGHVAMVCGHAGAGLVDIEPWLFTGRGGVAHGHGPAVGGLGVANAMVLCCACGDRGGAVSVLAVAPRTHAAIDGRRKQQPWHGRTTLDAGRVPAPSSVLAYGAGADRAGRVFYRVFFQQVPFAAEKGWSHLALVQLFPIYSVSVVVANLGSGWALDRWGVARLIPYFQIPLCVAFLVVGAAQDVTVMAVALILLGMVGGANGTLPNAFWAEFYGTRHLGAIKAMASAVMVLGSAIGPWVTGVGLEYGVSLATQFQWVAAYFAVASICMVIGVRRYRKGL